MQAAQPKSDTQSKFNLLESLAKLKKLSSNMDVTKPVHEEVPMDQSTQDSYEEKKKKELAKRIIREFKRAESIKDASEPQREINRAKIEAILKAETTIR